MATKLTKPVVRECMHARYLSRALVASIVPASEGESERIVVREKGRRHAFALPILTVYMLAAEDAGREAKRIRDAERRARRKSR